MFYALLFNLYTDTVDCSGCGLSWLIRGNRRLMFRIDYSAICSIGTNFNDLNPEGYRECPASTSHYQNNYKISSKIAYSVSLQEFKPIIRL